ncbi:MAG: hypothetical protein AAFX99_24360, partial [Myxococcota bacterium]
RQTLLKAPPEGGFAYSVAREPIMKADHLTIAEPCQADWNAMTGTASRRFCGSCQKHVHNLSEMTERQARKLLKQASCGTELCVRYRSGADGQIVFQPEFGLDVRLRNQLAGVRRLLAASAIAIPLLAGTAGLAVAQDHNPPGVEEVLLGEIEVVQGGLKPMPVPEPPKTTTTDTDSTEVDATQPDWALDLVKLAMERMNDANAEETPAPSPVVEPIPPKPHPQPVRMGRIAPQLHDL